jgi:rubrerythrin
MNELEVAYRAAEFRVAGRGDLAVGLERWLEDVQLAVMMGVPLVVCVCDQCGGTLEPSTAVCPACGFVQLPF